MNIETNMNHTWCIYNDTLAMHINAKSFIMNKVVNGKKNEEQQNDRKKEFSNYAHCT